jgi:hypothetical protein
LHFLSGVKFFLSRTRAIDARPMAKDIRYDASDDESMQLMSRAVQDSM